VWKRWERKRRRKTRKRLQIKTRYKQERVLYYSWQRVSGRIGTISLFSSIYSECLLFAHSVFHNTAASPFNARLLYLPPNFKHNKTLHLSTECIYAFHVILAVNNTPPSLSLNCFCLLLSDNGDAACFLWGANYIHKSVVSSARLGPLSDYTANCRPVLSSERTPHRDKTANFRQQHSDRK
jgi:hypothetical protein